MKTACKVAIEVLYILREQIISGITTCDLENVALAEVKKRGVKAAFKGYHGFPYAVCCSPNDKVVHGMPSDAPLKEGDILSLDFGVFADGFYGDAAITVPVGKVSEHVISLVSATEESLYAGIAQALPGNRLHDISYAIQSLVEKRGYSVVRDFVGHGIGTSLHEDPQVPNFGKPHTGVQLKPGMVLAIEPMINEKSYDVKILDDGWTVVTKDGGMSAHFEHTVAITEQGPEILTSI